jgi:hypothetical protein
MEQNQRDDDCDRTNEAVYKRKIPVTEVDKSGSFPTERENFPEDTVLRARP